MISENDFKKELIKLLNLINEGWIDGDKNKNGLQSKTADIVNHNLKIAIEIKDDHSFNVSSTNCKSDVQQYDERIKSANKKFKQYKDYKTILFIRTGNQINGLIKSFIDSLSCFISNGYSETYIGKIGKYKKVYTREEIGCFVVDNRGQKFHYYPNIFSNKNKKLSQDDVEKIFNRRLDVLDD